MCVFNSYFKKISFLSMFTRKADMFGNIRKLPKCVKDDFVITGLGTI